MSMKQCYHKLRKFLWKSFLGLSILIIGWSLTMMTVFWTQTRIRPLKELKQMESHSGLQLVDTINQTSYFTPGFKGSIVWIKFEIATTNLQSFLIKNGLDGKLTSSDEDHVITKVTDYNRRSIENFKTIFFKRIKAEDWMAKDFNPLFAFEGEHPRKAGHDYLRIVVGKSDQSMNTLWVYICD